MFRGELFGRFAFARVFLAGSFICSGTIVRVLIWVTFRFPHSVHHHPVYLLSEIQWWLVSLAETGKIFRQIEISGRIDIGANELHLGGSSVIPQVSLPDAEAMDKFIGFNSGLPSLDPALSILQILAPLRIQVSHRTQITT